MSVRSGVSSGSVCWRGRFGRGQRVNHRVKGESSASTRCCLMFEYVCVLRRVGVVGLTAVSVCVTVRLSIFSCFVVELKHEQAAF